MGRVCRPEKVKLIAGLLSGNPGVLAKAKESLAKKFGPIDFESPVTDFSYTDYYRNEMGDGLKRQFISFRKPFGLDRIFRVKAATNRIERHFAGKGSRTVNIDPGYVDLAKLVLFSTKDFSHRIYLGSGIYAEITLMYKGGSFNALPWTYPDYRTTGHISAFNAIREILKAKKRR